MRPRSPMAQFPRLAGPLLAALFVGALPQAASAQAAKEPTKPAAAPPAADKPKAAAPAAPAPAAAADKPKAGAAAPAPKPADAKPKLAVLGIEPVDEGDARSQDKTTKLAAALTDGLRLRARANAKYELAPNAQKDLTELKLLSDCLDEAAACMYALQREVLPAQDIPVQGIGREAYRS